MMPGSKLAVACRVRAILGAGRDSESLPGDGVRSFAVADAKCVYSSYARVVYVEALMVLDSHNTMYIKYSSGEHTRYNSNNGLFKYRSSC